MSTILLGKPTKSGFKAWVITVGSKFSLREEVSFINECRILSKLAPYLLSTFFIFTWAMKMLLQKKAKRSKLVELLRQEGKTNFERKKI
jgi:hypothetical protein